MNYEKDKIYTMKKVFGYNPGISFKVKVHGETSCSYLVELMENIKIPLYRELVKGQRHSFDKRLFQIYE